LERMTNAHKSVKLKIENLTEEFDALKKEHASALKKLSKNTKKPKEKIVK